MTHASSTRRWWTAALSLLACMALAAPAYAGPKEKPGDLLMGFAALGLLLLAMGLAVGSFGLTVNHIFRRRASMTFRVLCARPGWSLLAGIAVTLLGLGLLAVLRGAGPLQLVVLLGYLVGLLLFAIAAATRLAGRILDPTSLEDELPDARLILKAGLMLLALNLVPFIGTMLFAGIMLAAVGASLLGYFAKLGGPLQAAAVPAGAPLGPPGVAPMAPPAAVPIAPPAAASAAAPAAPSPVAGAAATAPLARPDGAAEVPVTTGSPGGLAQPAATVPAAPTRDER